MIAWVKFGLRRIARVRICNSKLSRLRGLMFSRLKDVDGALLVFPKEERVAIHMLFVFQSLDIYWIDSRGKIIEMQRAKPFALSLYKARKKARYVLELKAGLAKLGIGEKLTFDPLPDIHS
jgi:uncharacterized membrane protein (UPF0127 family)